MPELRKDPIIGRWVIISTNRGKRPSDFGRPVEETELSRVLVDISLRYVEGRHYGRILESVVSGL